MNVLLRLLQLLRLWKPPTGDITVGHELYTVAVSEIGNGERGSNNSGIHVGIYAASIGRKVPLVWCAAFVYHCYYEACAKLGIRRLVKPTPGAKRLCKNIVAAGGTKIDFEHARTGDVVLWHRGAKGSWKGHVAVLQSTNVPRQTFTAIHGNRGNFPANVHTAQHSNGEGNLLGFYRFPDHIKEENV